MARELNVDPESLHHASGDIQNHGESMIGVHHESLGESEAAQTGWVGSSAGALSAMLTTWSAVTTDHATRLSEHVAGLHTSATVFSEMDRTNAHAIRAVYQQGGQDGAEDL
jgi:WXG100 family type VII secretion target